MHGAQTPTSPAVCSAFKISSSSGKSCAYTAHATAHGLGAGGVAPSRWRGLSSVKTKARASAARRHCKVKEKQARMSRVRVEAVRTGTCLGEAHLYVFFDAWLNWRREKNSPRIWSRRKNASGALCDMRAPHTRLWEQSRRISVPRIIFPTRSMQQPASAVVRRALLAKLPLPAYLGRARPPARGSRRSRGGASGGTYHTMHHRSDGRQGCVETHNTSGTRGDAARGKRRGVRAVQRKHRVSG